MELHAKFYNRIGVFAVCTSIGAVGAAALYYGIYFVMALVNYFDGFYKHDTFYALYPTAISYLATFFTTGTLKHLPGYEIEINLGIPLLFGCGMIFLGFVAAVLLGKCSLCVSEQYISGKALFRKRFEQPLSALQSVRRCLFGGLILTVSNREYLFLCLKNRDQLLSALASEKTAV